MIYCVAIGTFTGFIFLICLLFVSGGNTEEIIASPLGPLLYIIRHATQSRAGSVCLLMFPLVCLLFATTAIMTTSSRMVWAFARDGGLPFSSVFAKVHRRLGHPLNSLILTTVLTIIFGCIFLGSSSAFNAIISASVVALGVSYAMPVAINCLRGRKMLPPRAFTLPTWFAWPANLLGVAYVIVTTVLFVFPPELPVTGSNMSKFVRHRGGRRWTTDTAQTTVLLRSPSSSLSVLSNGSRTGARISPDHSSMPESRRSKPCNQNHRMVCMFRMAKSTTKNQDCSQSVRHPTMIVR